jgi:conjugative relaxase-like TrwC/TraI family protein
MGVAMLRFTPIESARQAEHYYSQSDGGYYLQDGDLSREWGGKGAAMLGLIGRPDYEQFKRLINGLHPITGEQLTAKLVDHRIPGWDVTASVPKGVTTALERGDERIAELIWAAGGKVMSELEELATTRIRKGGRQEDRVTGNLVWYAVEHPETRPTKADGMPDWDRHIHFVVANATFDPVEKEWKAVKFRPLMDLHKWFSMRFDSYLAKGLAELGYEIEAKYKRASNGSRKYYSFDIKGVPETVITKFSRRSAEVDDAEKEVIEANKKRDQEKGLNPDDTPETLSPVARDKLGASSRQKKPEGMTLKEYRDYWNSRVTADEGDAIAETISRARKGLNPSPANTADKAMALAIEHVFEKHSVVDWQELAIAAMQRSMGAALPDDMLPEAIKQGVLLKDGQVTTKEVLAEEQRIIAFARQGRGAMAPLKRTGLEDVKSDIALSKEQAAMVDHVLKCPDQAVLVIGDAGTGKTRSVRAAFAAIDRPIAIIAPSANASRGVLRDEGFKTADTVAAFLDRPEEQAAIKNGVIWVDEAGQLPIEDLSELVDIAKKQNARLVLQGDPKQHAAVARHGNMMHVLQEFAGLPVGRLSEIWRQETKPYKQAVEELAKGNILAGFDGLDKLGWVKETRGYKPLVDEYMEALKTKKPKQKDKDRVIVIAPTHKEGDAITGLIRERLKQEEKLGGEDKEFQQLKLLDWSKAEKAEAGRYDGSEIIQFHRKNGPFKAGQRITAAQLLPHLSKVKPGNFSVFREATIGLAENDLIRITKNGWTKDGKHRLDNGTTTPITKILPNGDMVLPNGWIMGKDFAHLTHGYVATSHASQGKTVDRVLVAMNQDSLAAIDRKQFYVSISRGRERVSIYSDLAREALRKAIQRADRDKSATELMHVRPVRTRPHMRDRAASFAKNLHHRYRRLREQKEQTISRVAPTMERHYGIGR